MVKNKVIVSVIIPCLNEEKYITKCLDSVIHSDYPFSQMEIFVIDGMSSDKTRELIQTYTDQYKNIKLVLNPQKTAPAAMNLGIKSSQGEYIIRLDAHAVYPVDYISKLIYWHKKLNAQNVGGIWNIEALNKNKKSLSICTILTDKFGVGNALFRIGTQDVTEVDTVPFGCYRRSTFEEYGYYNEKLVRNQDIELNKRIKQGGGTIFLIPEIISTYYARETFAALAKNNYANGFWNILTVYYTKNFKSLSLRHFIPLIFILSLIIPAGLSFISLYLLLISCCSLLVYLIVILVRSVSLYYKNRKTGILMLLTSFVVLHFSYGFGSLSGIAAFVKRKYTGE
ncbi:MAG: glycosyltransferase family 2 protein [Spirochaetia bacterium]|nr:glycosyltransferase family 2 protein [Spirochaetia bacterium]